METSLLLPLLLLSRWNAWNWVDLDGRPDPLTRQYVETSTLPSTGGTVQITLSRWRHGFESRTGCQHGYMNEPPTRVARSRQILTLTHLPAARMLGSSFGAVPNVLMCVPT